MPEFAAHRLRQHILNMAYAGSTVHIACAFSIVEILAVLYRNHLRFAGDNTAQNRDYLILSKGHGVMAQYACLRELGQLCDADFEQYFADGTRLKGLSDAHVPGLEVSSGSLGHGLSVGVGLALAAKRNRTNQWCYAVIGDGEMNEGSIWEALLFAQHQRLDHLVVIVDENGFQAMGKTEDVLELGDLGRKFEAFGFVTERADGHDEAALQAALLRLKAGDADKPKALIARTVKGKGVSFMEADNRWHYTRLDAETHQKALLELESHP
jgi:transketolase